MRNPLRASAAALVVLVVASGCSSSPKQPDAKATATSPAPTASAVPGLSIGCGMLATAELAQLGLQKVRDVASTCLYRRPGSTDDGVSIGVLPATAAQYRTYAHELLPGQVSHSPSGHTELGQNTNAVGLTAPASITFCAGAAITVLPTSSKSYLDQLVPAVEQSACSGDAAGATPTSSDPMANAVTGKHDCRPVARRQLKSLGLTLESAEAAICLWEGKRNTRDGLGVIVQVGGTALDRTLVHKFIRGPERRSPSGETVYGTGPGLAGLRTPASVTFCGGRVIVVQSSSRHDYPSQLGQAVEKTSC